MRVDDWAQYKREIALAMEQIATGLQVWADGWSGRMQAFVDSYNAAVSQGDTPK